MALISVLLRALRRARGCATFKRRLIAAVSDTRKRLLCQKLGGVRELDSNGFESQEYTQLSISNRCLLVFRASGDRFCAFLLFERGSGGRHTSNQLVPHQKYHCGLAGAASRKPHRKEQARVGYGSADEWDERGLRA